MAKNKPLDIQVVAMPGRVARLLSDVIDIHVEGLEEAKKETTDDPTVRTADELCDLMADYDRDIRDLQKLKRSLDNAIGEITSRSHSG